MAPSTTRPHYNWSLVAVCVGNFAKTFYWLALEVRRGERSTIWRVIDKSPLSSSSTIFSTLWLSSAATIERFGASFRQNINSTRSSFCCPPYGRAFARRQFVTNVFHAALTTTIKIDRPPRPSFQRHQTGCPIDCRTENSRARQTIERPPCCRRQILCLHTRAIKRFRTIKFEFQSAAVPQSSSSQPASHDPNRFGASKTSPTRYAGGFDAPTSGASRRLGCAAR